MPSPVHRNRFIGAGEGMTRPLELRAGSCLTPLLQIEKKNRPWRHYAPCRNYSGSTLLLRAVAFQQQQSRDGVGEDDVGMCRPVPRCRCSACRRRVPLPQQLLCVPPSSTRSQAAGPRAAVEAHDHRSLLRRGPWPRATTLRRHCRFALPSSPKPLLRAPPWPRPRTAARPSSPWPCTTAVVVLCALPCERDKEGSVRERWDEARY